MYVIVVDMRKKFVELSKETRLKTLAMILEGKDYHHMAMELGISVKGVKFRLTHLYKYYGVKNRIELMAMYIKPPSCFYGKTVKFQKFQTVRRNKNWEQFRPESSELPIGKK